MSDDLLQQGKRLIEQFEQWFAIAEQRVVIAKAEAKEKIQAAEKSAAKREAAADAHVAAAQANVEKISQGVARYHREMKAQAEAESETIVAHARERAAEIEKAAARQQPAVTQASGAGVLLRGAPQ